MKYKVGDSIKIREWDDMINDPDTHVDNLGDICFKDDSIQFLTNMKFLCGAYHSIKNVTDKYYELEEYEDLYSIYEWMIAEDTPIQNLGMSGTYTAESLDSIKGFTSLLPENNEIILENATITLINTTRDEPLSKIKNGDKVVGSYVHEDLCHYDATFFIGENPVKVENGLPKYITIDSNNDIEAYDRILPVDRYDEMEEEIKKETERIVNSYHKKYGLGV